jgi:hypothetical protein
VTSAFDLLKQHVYPYAAPGVDLLATFTGNQHHLWDDPSWLAAGLSRAMTGGAREVYVERLRQLGYSVPDLPASGGIEAWNYYAAGARQFSEDTAGSGSTADGNNWLLPAAIIGALLLWGRR